MVDPQKDAGSDRGVGRRNRLGIGRHQIAMAPSATPVVMYGATACSAGAIGVDARMPTDDVIATPTCAATKYVVVTCTATKSQRPCLLTKRAPTHRRAQMASACCRFAKMATLADRHKRPTPMLAHQKGAYAQTGTNGQRLL